MNLNLSECPKKAKKAISTLKGITNWSHFVWPISSELYGHICIRSLPNFGSWNTFSPYDIKKAMKDQEFIKPDSIISDRTIPKSE